MRIGYIRSNFTKIVIGFLDGGWRTVETVTRADICDALIELDHDLLFFANTVKSSVPYGEKIPLKTTELPTLDLLLVEIATTYWQSKENFRIIQHYMDRNVPMLVRLNDPDYRISPVVNYSQKTTYLTTSILDNPLLRKSFNIPTEGKLVFLPYLALREFDWARSLDLARSRRDYIFMGNYFTTRIKRVREFFQDVNPAAKIYGKSFKGEEDYSEEGWVKMGFIDIEHVPEILKTAKATTVVQQPLFNKTGLIGSRVTEPAMYGCLTFIDDQSEFLQPYFDSFYFVGTKYELQSKLNVVMRWDPQTYIEKTSEQFDLLYSKFGWKEYKRIFQKAIEEALNENTSS